MRSHNSLYRKIKVVDSNSPFHNKVVDVLIEKGKIKDMGRGIRSSKIKEAPTGNRLLVPGLVDVFADYREPGYEQHETIESGMACAYAGGFRHVFLTPNTRPAVADASVVRYLIEKAGSGPVRIYPMGALSAKTEGTHLAEMLEMKQAGAVAFTDGWLPVQNNGLMLKALEYVKAFNGLIVQLPLEQSIAHGGLMHEGEISTALGMAGIPQIAETIMIKRDIELLRYTGSRLHITGISTQESVSLIKAAKKEGLQISCSVTPYHLALTDEFLKTYDSNYKTDPPLRTEKDRQALIAGLKDETIDCIASHHRPQDWDAKQKEFEYAAAGMNIQQQAFEIAYKAVSGKVELERLIDAFCHRPRAIFGLPPAKLGTDEDFVILDLDFPAQKQYSLSENNPFISFTESLPI